MRTERLQTKLANLPSEPGVYLFKSEKEKVLYVGKAKSLKNRVRSYFQESRNLDVKTRRLVERIADLELIVTDSEMEALILESNLVKQNQPPFNVLLKDGKNFPYIKLTINEPYPRAFITRTVERDGALYYGPFLPSSLAYDTLKLIEKYFLARNCDIEIDGKRDRPCLDYYIKRCLGPCVAGLTTKEEYDQAVKDVRLFLEGKSEALLQSLEQKMLAAAEGQRYELAAYYRDSMAKIRALGERQKMIMHSMNDADIFGYHQEGCLLALQVFAMRGSRVVGRREFYWEDLISFDPKEFISTTLKQYYVNDTYVPSEIYVPDDFDEHALIEQWLSDRKGQRVKIIQPKRGDKLRLLELVTRNAKIAFDNRFRVMRAKNEQVLEELRQALALSAPPQRIECFDISNIQGTDSVASVVVCENGEMNKGRYRRFKIKTVEGADDFASMYEVVYRRYKRLLAEDREHMPNLVLIDGGIGQLHAAVNALADLGLADQPVASIAKREELLYVPGREQDPIRLDHTSPALHLVQRIRDEAHRFAVTYHRKRRALRDFSSELLDIPGVGERRKAKLLRNFGSLERVKHATVQELTPFVGPKHAQTIVYYFSKQRELEKR
jgi:excinuclease ABC subunit C